MCVSCDSERPSVAIKTYSNFILCDSQVFGGFVREFHFIRCCRGTDTFSFIEIVRYVVNICTGVNEHKRYDSIDKSAGD